MSGQGGEEEEEDAAGAGGQGGSGGEEEEGGGLISQRLPQEQDLSAEQAEEEGETYSFC